MSNSMTIRELELCYVSERTVEAPDGGRVTPDSVFAMARAFGLGQHPYETAAVILIDGDGRSLGMVRVGRGTVHSTPMYPRDVFGPALHAQASSVILLHDHPSGDPTPSEADRSITSRMMLCGEILGVEVLAHVVIAHSSWTVMVRSKEDETGVGVVIAVSPVNRVEAEVGAR